LVNSIRQPFLHRLFIYQKERFPVLVHGLLIAAFSFSAIAYSRLCRGVYNFIPYSDYAACVFTNLTLFFLLRVSDEYKDREDDARYRTYLPVVRGLITLKELSATALVFFFIATVINIIFFPKLLFLYALMMGYLLLMRVEFFAASWLRKRQILYNTSHMLIIPLADMYASGYDWQLHHATPPKGLLFFFGVSYFNGVVLEIGRKIRVPDKEEEGVVSYTKLWGIKKAPVIWLIILITNCVLALLAAIYAHANTLVLTVLVSLFIIAAIPAILFTIKPSQGRSKAMEIASLVWALGMYLTLGGIPFLLK
jgi:hypothetical protein